jgi:hypothetical protein
VPTSTSAERITTINSKRDLVRTKLESAKPSDTERELVAIDIVKRQQFIAAKESRSVVDSPATQRRHRKYLGSRMKIAKAHPAIGRINVDA